MPRPACGTAAAAFAAVSIGALAVTATASALVATLSPGAHPLVDGGSPLLQAQNMAGQSTALVACTVAVVVAATFAMMIEQRRSEMALLSLIGALPRQVRRLVVTEAVLLAMAAASAPRSPTASRSASGCGSPRQGAQH